MKFYDHDFMNYGSTLLAIIVIIAIASLCLFILRKSLTVLQSRWHISDSSLVVIRSIGRWFIFILTLLFILQQFGVKVSVIISSLLAIAAMIAIGFIAVWSILSNLLCSLLLITFKPFEIGEEIEITEPFGGTSLRGKVLKFNAVYTSLLETTGGEEYITSVPNNIFFQKAVRQRKGSGKKSEN